MNLINYQEIKIQHCIDILVYNMNTNRLVNSLYFTLGHQFLFLIFPSQSQDPQCFRISEENEGSWQVAGTSVKRNQKVPASGSLVFFCIVLFLPLNLQNLLLLAPVLPYFLLISCCSFAAAPTVVPAALQTLFLAFSVNDDTVTAISTALMAVKFSPPGLIIIARHN